MRIKTQKRPLSKWWLIIPILVLIYFISGLKKGNTVNTKKEESTYFCDAEEFKDGEFITPEKNFRTRCKKTSATSFTGKSSCKCGEGERFALIADLDDLSSFDTIKVSAAAKNGERTKLKFVLSSDNKHYFSEDLPAGKTWSEHETQFIIPSLDGPAKWKIYLHMATGKGPAYFDDFSIKINKFGKSGKNNFEGFPELELQINKVNFKKVENKRNAAMKKGLLFSSQADFVDADLRVDSMTLGCSVRLKGDLLDHLYGEKWSYRVALKGDEVWRQMNTFSVHNSEARSHLAEWVMHQMMRKEGIISPKYDFFRFSVNKKDMGVFAYEHHFEDEFLTENDRLIAPVIKHNDNGFWDNLKGGLKKYNWVPSTQIELFNKENENKKSFADLYQHGHNQLHHFLFSNRKAEEVFDLDKMARYYALIEIGHGTHAQLLTNIRFYVNPATGLLEPVGYDFYSSNMPKINEDWRPIGQWENGQDIHKRSMSGSSYLVRLFADHNFFGRYLSYVEKFTDPKYLKQRFKELEIDIKTRNKQIQTDSTYKEYEYDFFEHFIKAKYTRAKLYPLSNVALKSFRDSRSKNIHLQSFHYFPLKITGYRNAKGSWLLEEPIIMDGYSPNSSLKTVEIECLHRPTEIIYQTLGIDSTFYHDVSKNILPKDNSRLINRYVSLSESSQFQSDAGSYTAMTKTVIIDKHYKISKEESLVIPSGTRVQFNTNGSLTIEGKISAIGSPSAPIIFLGNKRGNGMVLTKSERENSFQYCFFNNLSAYRNGILKLDAAINIDESRVRFDNCKWSAMNAPVDVKINNSEFNFFNCSFENNAGSAIHSFYSEGRMDAMDISNYGKGGIKQVGGNISGEAISISNSLGTALTINDFANSRFSKVKFIDCHSSLQVANHSDVRIEGYEGNATFRDIQVTGDNKPYNNVVIVGAEDAGKLTYIVSPKSILKINHTRKRMK